uniref:Endochitinase A-like isoform X2 n=1 Tax=Populus alba TaxID=43335 RepID=A0A4U5MZI9_POPAL|nr:endochitinase A-like isoform X2 [Populus alba]
MASDTKRGYVSRLSPLAKPFILKTPKNSSSVLNSSLQDTGLSPSSSRLAQSFSSFSVEGKSAELGYKAHKSGDHQEILHWKDKHGGFSMSNDDPTKQGSPTEGLKLRAETSDHVCKKFSGISRKDDEVRPKSTRQTDTQYVSFSAVKSRPISSKFSTSSDLHSSALVQDPQSGVPAISWSSDDSDIASFERRFSQQLDACTTKVNFPPSSDSNSLRALDSESPGTGSSDSPFNHALSQNLDSGGHGGVSKSGIFWYSLASLVDTAVDKSKEVFHDKVLTDKSKGKMGKPATQEVMEPLSMTKSELQITFPSHPIELASKSLGVKESDPIGNSSEIINENDSDLDSPCWKGKLSANQSTCEVSRPDDFQHLKSARGACSNLNPLAPHFFPSCGKQKVNYRGTECEGDDSLTFQKTESSAVCLFSREHTLQKPGTAGSSSSDRSSITETHCSIDNHVPNKENEPLTNSSTSSMLSSSCVGQPSILEDYFTSIGQLLTRQKVGGSGKIIEDAVPNGSTSVSLLASEHVRPISTRQIDSQHVSFSAVMSRPISSKFSPSSDLHSSALVQDALSGVPAISWSSDDSDIASFERRFSQQLDACTTKVNFPPSSDSNSLRALDSESPGTGSSDSPFNHALSQNLDSGGHGGVSKSGIFWYSLASLVDTAVDKSKEVFHDKVLTDKSKGKMGKPATQEVMEPLSMTKSELQIAFPSHPIELASKSLGVKESDPIGNSSEIINENDSDLDSPCWKGKLSANQSTCEVSRPDDFQHLKSARGACSNLNPLAPHFFPSCGKQKVNYRGTECEGDDSLTFQKTESSAVCLFSREHTLQKPGTAGSSSLDRSSITETHCSIENHVPNKENEPLTNSSTSSMLSSSCVGQPSILEDYFTSIGQLLTRQKVGGSGKVIEDAVPNGSTSVSLLASEHVRPISTRQIDSQHVSFSAVMSRPISSKFSPSSDLHSSALVQDALSGVPAISWSSDDSDIASFERRFSQQLDACTTKVNFPPSSDSNSLRALDSESPGTGSSDSPFNHALSQNLDSGGHGGVSKSGIFWYSLASLVDAAVDKSKEVFHDKVLTDKSKGKMGKPATQEVMEPLSMTKSELQITCPSHPMELASKSLGVKENDPIGNSSEIINENDSDLDSPCWKGKLSANQSTSEVSRPDDFQHLKSARGACSNLNPLAPHFFPSCGKQKVNYRGTECEGDDSLTFQKTESSAVCLSSTEQTLQKTVTAGSSSSDQSSITETHCYIDMHVLNKEYEQLTNTNSSSMLSSSCLVQPSIPEDYFISNSQLLTGKKVGGSGKFIEDAVSNGSTSVSLHAGEHVTSSSSCRVGVSSALSEAYGLVTKPLCTPPKLDIQIVVKTINQVSELLMQNCSYDLDSLNEHEHDIMKRVVYNLNACIRNRAIEEALEGHQQLEEEENPQVLLYKNSWLEAEAALCSMKYKACVLGMKTEM